MSSFPSILGRTTPSTFRLLNMDDGTLETLFAKAYTPPDYPKRGVISLLFFLGT